MHKCVRCGAVYEDNDTTILRGCAKCSAIFFLYFKKPEDMETLDAVEKELKEKETTLEKELTKEIKKRKAERKVRKPPERVKAKEKLPKELEIKVAVEEEFEEEAEEKLAKPVRVKKEIIRIGKTKFAVEDLFGIETIRVPKDGVYEINIDALMKKKPIIVLERGRVYFIHLPSAFERAKGSL